MKVVTISSWLNFDRPHPPGRGSVAVGNFLAPPYYSQCAVFASPPSAFFIFNDSPGLEKCVTLQLSTTFHDPQGLGTLPTGPPTAGMHVAASIVAIFVIHISGWIGPPTTQIMYSSGICTKFGVMTTCLTAETVQLMGAMPQTPFWGLCPLSRPPTALPLDSTARTSTPSLLGLACRPLKIYNVALCILQARHPCSTPYSAPAMSLTWECHLNQYLFNNNNNNNTPGFKR